MTILKSSHLVAIVSAAIALAGCAANPPKSLLDARAAYDRALASKAPELAPADLQNAKESLSRAEMAFSEEGDGRTTQSLSYVSVRTSELASVRADVTANTHKKQDLEKQLVNTATDTAEAKTKQLAVKDQQLENSAEKLATEKKARAEAEAKMKDAMNRLTAIASVKEEPRGLVITMPGGVLFESGKAELLGTAKERLNQVADALLLGRDGTIVVEGHTDSQGNDSINDKLSDDRAASVRNYLISRGVAADRITSSGKGSKSPVADNKSAEGRANNRRVEIVVANAGKK